MAEIKPGGQKHHEKHTPVRWSNLDVAERDRLRDLDLVADARHELEGGFKLRAAVGAQGQSTSGARLDLVVNCKLPAHGHDSRVPPNVLLGGGEEA